MTSRGKSIARGSLAMLGAIIGAGVFAMPFAFKTMGVIAGSLVYWAIALTLLLTNILYADVMLSSSEFRQTLLIQQARRVLGEWPSYLAYLTLPLSLIGACLAYIKLGGSFLSILAGTVGLPTQIEIWQVLFWTGGAIALFFGLKTVSRIQSFMGWVLVTLLAISVIVSVPSAHLPWLGLSQWASSLSVVGVIVFALSGYQIIPEIVQIGGRNRRWILAAVTLGTLGAALLEWFFGISMYLAIGPSLQSGATDLIRAFPPSIGWLLPLVGFFSVGTSFVGMLEILKFVFVFEFHLSETAGWILPLLFPFALTFFVQQDFIQTVGFVGSVFGSLNGMLIAAMAMVLIRRKKIIVGWPLQAAAVLSFAIFLFAFLWRILNA